MTASLISRPPTDQERALHVQRWQEIVVNPMYAKLDGKFESDRYGHLIMSPPPGKNHGKRQSEISYLLRVLLGHAGSVVTECPIVTSDGVKSADVAWISKEREAQVPDEDPCYRLCPEICVEVISPSNTQAEMQEKMSLYFEAGAEEVWFCEDGQLRFHLSADAPPADASRLCPEMVPEIKV